MSRADGNFDPIEAVRAFLEEARCDSQIKRTEATIFTVSDASAAVGAPEEEILKSILLRVNHGKSYALALMSGVEPQKLQEYIYGDRNRLYDIAERLRARKTIDFIAKAVKSVDVPEKKDAPAEKEAE